MDGIYAVLMMSLEPVSEDPPVQWTRDQLGFILLLEKSMEIQREW